VPLGITGGGASPTSPHRAAIMLILGVAPEWLAVPRR
jgi:hypothetical protein